jgi:hypothetical protein
MVRGRPKKQILDEIDRRLNADDVLTPDEKEAIRAKAVEHVAKTKKESTEEALLHAYIKEEERKDKPEEELIDITLDLPEHAPFIRLDNRVWFHGVVYEVEMSVYQTMMDIQGRMWEQERQTQGEGKYRHPRQMKISPSHPGGAL